MPDQNEAAFRDWYAGWAQRTGINPNPDDPLHHYDYRKAFEKGFEPKIGSDGVYHWPSPEKDAGHPNKIVGGFDTVTGARVPGTPRAADAAELRRLGWDDESAARLAAMPDPQAPTSGKMITIQVDGLGPVELPEHFGYPGNEHLIQNAVDKIPESAFEAARARTPARTEPERDTSPLFPAEGQGQGGRPRRPDPMADALEAGGRAAGGVWEYLNPIPLIKRGGTALMDERGPEVGMRKLGAEIVSGAVAGGHQAQQKARERFAHARGSSGLDRVLAGSEAAGYGLASMIPILGPAAAGIGETAGSGDIARAGGQTIGLLAGPKIAKGAATGLKTGARTLAQGVMGGASPAVAEAALKYNALPGLFRKGASRTERQIGRAEAEADRAAAAAGPLPLGRVQSQGQTAAWRDVQQPLTSKAAVDAARTVGRETQDFIRAKPTVAEGLGRARATRRDIKGDTTGRGQLGRGASFDIRNAAGRAVPAAAPALEKVNALVPAAEAYAAKTGALINPEGLPNMWARLAASSVERSLGPTAQGMYRAGRVAEPVMRAALINNLLEKGSRSPEDAPPDVAPPPSAAPRGVAPPMPAGPPPSPADDESAMLERRRSELPSGPLAMGGRAAAPAAAAPGIQGSIGEASFMPEDAGSMPAAAPAAAPRGGPPPGGLPTGIRATSPPPVELSPGDLGMTDFNKPDVERRGNVFYFNGRPTTPENVIRGLATQEGVPADLALAVARKESSLNPRAVGDGGKALGMFQLHAGAASDAGIADRGDPVQNITGGVRYLRQLMRRYPGDMRKVLQAYNGGMGNVDRGTVSREADAYAETVLAALERRQ